jgi:anti-anti-sigma factor
MKPGPFEHWLEVETVGPTTVVRFKRRTILEAAAIQAVGDHLIRLAGEDGQKTILLNFRGVESLTSAMLGEFAVLQRALNDSGGRLAFCNVEPFLKQLFKVVKIAEQVPFYEDEPQALQALDSAPQ